MFCLFTIPASRVINHTFIRATGTLKGFYEISHCLNPFSKLLNQSHTIQHEFSCSYRLVTIHPVSLIIQCENTCCFSMVLFNSYNNTIMLDGAYYKQSSLLSAAIELLSLSRCGLSSMLWGFSNFFSREGWLLLICSLTRFFQSLCGIEPLAFQSLVFCPKLKTTPTLTH